MKTLLPMFVCFLAMQPVDERHPVDEKHHTVGDYEDMLVSLQDWSDNLTNPDHWKDMKLTDKKTQESKTFSDLSDYEKSIFYFLSAEKLTNELKTLDVMWQAELSKFDKKEVKDDKDDKKEDRKSKEATKEDVEKYCNQLLELRKVTAVRFEALAADMFDKFKDKFTAEERDETMKQIREFHDKDKLIERKK